MMFLKIINTLQIGKNLSITVSGTHEKLKNGTIIKDDNNNEFMVLSVAMVNPLDKNIREETTMLIKGTPAIGTKIYI